VHLGKDLSLKRTRLAGLAVALALACVACSDDPEPKLSPPESSSPAPTETETTSEPPEPKPLNPEETVRAWVEARDVLMLTGEASGVEGLSARSCTTCADQINPLKAVHRAGGSFETRGWRVVRSQVDSTSATRAQVTAGLAMAGGTTYPRADAEPVNYSPEKRIAVFKLTRAGGTWTVQMIGFLE
jgi:hypothetical protein